LVNGSFQTVATLIYQSRKGIKAWIVTFGALVILLTFIIIIVVSFVKYSKMKIANKKKNYLRRKET
jgi:spermidine/putrescine transport system permease protein